MTKQEALERGYCGQCAGYYNEGWKCGLVIGDKINCQLTPIVIKRWDHDLDLAKRLKGAKDHGNR